MALPEHTHTPSVVNAAFYGIGLLGTVGTWGRAVADGTVVHLFNALHRGAPYILPGSEFALKTSFSGIHWPIDYLLDVLIIFFWEAVDGSHPTESTIGIYFLGQLFAMIVVLYMSYVRYGVGASFVKPTVWALSFQMCAIACTGWLWGLSFVATSPTTSTSISRDRLREVSLANPHTVLYIPLALALAYIVPAIAMGLPSPEVVSNDFQQWALVAWNMFPISAFLLMKTFAAMDARIGSQQSSARAGKQPASSTSDRQHLSAVRRVTAVTLAISFATHIAVFGISICTVLFPTIFNQGFSQRLSPTSLFVPPIAIGNTATVGDGLRSFFLWDQLSGYLVMILVALVQLHSAARVRGVHFSWTKAIGVITLVSCIAGPGSACLIASWLRDELLFRS